MSGFEVSLEAREAVAEGTMAFHFEKPGGFAFEAGQSLDLVLGEPPGAARHAFSVVSAPFEDRLTIATRMRDSAFKRALKAMPVGSPAQIEGPFGSMTLHGDSARPAIFIAGGIGITPFMSILRQAARDRAPHRLILVYSNRRPEDAAFLAELQELERRYDNFRLAATMTALNGSSDRWDGRTGLIDANLLRQLRGGLPAPIHYVAGPPAMVAAMRRALNESGIEDDDIRREEFSGY